MDKGPIEITLERIGQNYQPGVLAWLKKRPGEWARLIGLEQEVDRVALLNDEVGLTTVLGKYQDFILRKVREFKIPKAETGNLFERQ
jgi:hypothetical protein